MRAKTINETLNYRELANEWWPSEIKTLLIAEAPPPNSSTYFYKPEKSGGKGLPWTIFTHYFGTYPKSITEYETFLEVLKMKGIALMDITDEPVQVSIPDPKRPGRNARDINMIRKIRDQFPELRKRVDMLGVPNENIIFIPPGKSYHGKIKQFFPGAKIYDSWIKFAHDKSEL